MGEGPSPVVIPLYRSVEKQQPEKTISNNQDLNP